MSGTVCMLCVYVVSAVQAAIVVSFVFFVTNEARKLVQNQQYNVNLEFLPLCMYTNVSLRVVCSLLCYICVRGSLWV